jgi:hypothetical protein
VRLAHTMQLQRRRSVCFATGSTCTVGDKSTVRRRRRWYGRSFLFLEKATGRFVAHRERPQSYTYFNMRRSTRITLCVVVAFGWRHIIRGRHGCTAVRAITVIRIPMAEAAKQMYCLAF